MQIRTTTTADHSTVLDLHRQAFGQDEEADLVDALLADPSATPRVSLLALQDDRPVGHILFTRATVMDHEENLSASILAPLAVVPDMQGTGIGDTLIKAGVQHLTDAGADLVFVLGHPAYYPRAGFTPAKPYGLLAPYPIPDEHADAWMVQALGTHRLDAARGKVICCDALNKPEYWVE